MFIALVALGSMAHQAIQPLLDSTHEITAGHGVAAAQGDLVTIEFIVRLQSGKEIANTIKRGLPYTLRITAADSLFATAVKGMQKTGEREVQITYPEPGIPGIAPASKPLTIWMKLIEIQPAATGL